MRNDLANTATTTAPDRTEAAEYYFTDIDQVATSTDICRTLEEQGEETLGALRKISPPRRTRGA